MTIHTWEHTIYFNWKIQCWKFLVFENKFFFIKEHLPFELYTKRWNSFATASGNIPYVDIYWKLTMSSKEVGRWKLYYKQTSVCGLMVSNREIWLFGGSPYLPVIGKGGGRLMDCWSRNVNTTHSHEFRFFYLFIYSTFFSAVCGNILTRGLQYRRVLFSSSGWSSGGSGGCGMVCRRWTESGGVVVHLASCRPQPVRRVRPLTVFIPRILDVQPAPLLVSSFLWGVPTTPDRD